MDHSKPPGHACSADGTLLDASEMEWDDPDAPQSNKRPPNGDQLDLRQASHQRRKMSSAVKATGEKSRENLTLADKLSVIDWMTHNPKKSQKEVVAHFRTQFPSLSQSSVSRTWSSRQSLLDRAKDHTQLSNKKTRQVEHPDLEESLRAWSLQQLGKGNRLTGDLIRGKAAHFQELLGIPENQRLAFSNGWLDKFKLRIDLKEHRMHGEAGSASVNDVEAAIRRIQNLTDPYPLCDIYNFDETGLFYRMPPDRGLAREQTSGVKGDKIRLSYGLTCNADGSVKPEALVIGKFRRPRAFQKKEGRALGFNYFWNKKAWMTSSIFQM